MAQVAILAGYKADRQGLVASVPVNLTPVATVAAGEGSGISNGYLRTADGVVKRFDTARDRGGYAYGGVHYRVLGSNLCQVDTAVTVIGSVIDDDRYVQFAESFDRLAVASAGRLFYLQNGILTQVTDPDLGKVLSVTWSDGYFITTDGTSLVVTQLADPTQVDPLKYGSSEADPDPIVGVLAQRGSLYAINRYTIEVFGNTGGTGFPFARQRGSQIPKGATGSAAYTPFVETFAFCGSARGEACAIYLAGAGQGIRISTSELDSALADMSEAQLAAVQLEAINSSGAYRLLVHLVNETWVYHWTVSQQFDFPVWTRLAGGLFCETGYPARNFTLIGTNWWCGSDNAIGVVDDSTPMLFGTGVGFQCDTPIVYNGGAGVIVSEMELVTLGQSSSAVSLAYSDDGQLYGQARMCGIGNAEAARRRTIWRRLGRMRHWRTFRFTGAAQEPFALIRLEVQAEPLS